MNDQSKPYLTALNLVKKAPKGIPFSISHDWAEQLQTDFNLTLKQRNSDMTGEKSALFEYDGEMIRIEKDWMGHYNLYRGEWESDPHWTGD